MRIPSPRRPLNPLLLRRVLRSSVRPSRLTIIGGFPNHQIFAQLLRYEKIPATPLTVMRLQRVAEAINFPDDEIFLDGAGR